MRRTDIRGATDIRAGRFLSWLLLVGLLIAVLLMVAGAVLAATGANGPMVRETSLADLPHALASLQPLGFIILGLVVLLATPVARVVALLLMFARQRSWWFCGICSVVLAVLALSVFLGLRG
ncbi:MAG: DUF1634 domain-containing protein [Thermoleophilia bacterium]|nr:DUF1634 domain-containing protein [Thermoleophilia bacterium]